jgi:hypothetical protein
VDTPGGARDRLEAFITVREAMDWRDAATAYPAANPHVRSPWSPLDRAQKKGKKSSSEPRKLASADVRRLFGGKVNCNADVLSPERDIVQLIDDECIDVDAISDSCSSPSKFGAAARVNTR